MELSVFFPPILSLSQRPIGRADLQGLLLKSEFAVDKAIAMIAQSVSVYWSIIMAIAVALLT
jgi:hypothetical protein